MSNQPERVLFVHAHPDDESIATGGTIATLVDLGVVVTVLPTEERAMTRRCFSPGTYNSADNLVHGKYALMPEIHAKLGRVFDACLSPKTGPAFLPKPDEHKPPTNGAAGTGTAGQHGADVAEVSSGEPTGPAETRTPDQQRHDILAAMIDGFARSGITPTIGGASPTGLVSVRAENLNTGHGAGFVSLGGPAVRAPNPNTRGRCWRSVPLQNLSPVCGARPEYVPRRLWFAVAVLRTRAPLPASARPHRVPRARPGRHRDRRYPL